MFDFIVENFVIDNILLGVVICGYVGLIIDLWRDEPDMHYCRRCNASATRRGDVVQDDSQAYECSKCLQYYKLDGNEPVPPADPKPKPKAKILWR